MKNRRLVITRKGGPEVLDIISEDMPAPGAGQARIKVLVSGVAFGDVLKREGLLPGMPRHPFTPGYELVGEIEALAPDVRGFSVGERVAAFVGNGANADFVNVPASWLVRVPDGVGSEEALCLVLNYVTAFQMLHRVAKVRRGQDILIHGAAGGVGTALLELGAIAGLRSMYGTASLPKHDVVRSLGGIPIDYKSEDFVARVLADLPEGLHVAFDPIGGRHISRSCKVLRKGGSLVVYGASRALEHGVREFLSTFLRIGACNFLPNGKRARFYGIGAGRHGSRRLVQDDLATLLSMLGEGKLKPIIGARFPLADAAKAHELMNASTVCGKVLCSD